MGHFSNFSLLWKQGLCVAMGRLSRPRGPVMFCLALMFLGAAPAVAGEVLVAVASNFAAPAARIAAAFEARTGHRVQRSSGSTGKFYSQVLSGAPFEILLAADAETPARLLQSRHAVAGSSMTYAMGQLVLWSATPGLVDAQGAVLRGNRFRHLAIANPTVAPYGAAARQSLKALGIIQEVQDRIVTGESVGQVYQFVATGNAELGFLALSQVMDPQAPPGAMRPLKGSMWQVPSSLYNPIRQDAVLLTAGAANPVARAFMQFLKSDDARRLIASSGYLLP